MLSYTPVYNEYGQVVGYRWRNRQGQEETTPVAGGTWGNVPTPPPPPMARRDLGRLGRLTTRAGQQAPTSPAAVAPSSFTAGGYGAPGQSGSSGSSSSGPLAKQLYQKFAGNIQGDISGSPTEQDYTQSERRYNAASRGWEQTLKNRQEATALQTNPIWALPPGGVSEADYGYWSNLPLGQLTMLTRGYQGRDRFTDSANRLGNAMQRTANSMQDQDASTLLQNLFSANRNSALGRSFQMQQEPKFRTDDNGIFQGMKEGKWKWAPAGTQAGVMQSYLNAIYGTQYPTMQQQPAMDYVNKLIDQWAARAYNKNNPGSLINWLGNQMGY